MSLSGKRALVTGGNQGLGIAICDKLQSQGCEVLVTSRTKESGENSKYQCYNVDFLDPDAIEKFALKSENLGIDILVNNAGNNRISPIAELNIRDFREVLETNLIAPTLLSKAVLPHMRANSWGRIINIASVFGEVGREFRAAYSASKFGLIGLTKSMAAEVAIDGVLINAVSPGPIESKLTTQILGDNGIEAIKKQIPVGRLGTADEVAALVAFLASNESSFISGQSIVIDGGFISV